MREGSVTTPLFLLLLLLSLVRAHTRYFSFYDLTLSDSSHRAPDLAGTGPTMAGGSQTPAGVRISPGEWRNGSVSGLALSLPQAVDAVEALVVWTPEGCEGLLHGVVSKEAKCGIVCAGEDRTTVSWRLVCGAVRHNATLTTRRGKKATFRIRYLIGDTNNSLGVSVSIRSVAGDTQEQHISPVAFDLSSSSTRLVFHPAQGVLHSVAHLSLVSSPELNAVAAASATPGYTYVVTYVGCKVNCPYGCRSDALSWCVYYCPTGMTVTGRSGSFVTCGCSSGQTYDSSTGKCKATSSASSAASSSTDGSIGLSATLLAVLIPIGVLLLTAIIVIVICICRYRNLRRLEQRLRAQAHPPANVAILDPAHGPHAVDKSKLKLDSVRLSAECKICYRPDALMVAMLPCGHAAVCEDCVKKIVMCPFDRVKIVEWVVIDKELREQIEKTEKKEEVKKEEAKKEEVKKEEVRKEEQVVIEMKSVDCKTEMPEASSEVRTNRGRSAST